MVGVTGALYAMRRALFVEMPAGLILDDVFQPMQVLRQGRRVLFLPEAIATDTVFTVPGKEFGRKVRTLTGNFQLLSILPWLLTPTNPVLFRFVSHKLLRLFVPYLLIAMFVTSFVSSHRIVHATFFAEVTVLAFALLGRLVPGTLRWRPVSLATTFLMLNVAAALAMYKFVRGEKVWT